MKKCKILRTLLIAICILALLPVSVSAESAATYSAALSWLYTLAVLIVLAAAFLILKERREPKRG